jgi:hypothetical protein
MQYITQGIFLSTTYYHLHGKEPNIMQICYDVSKILFEHAISQY